MPKSRRRRVNDRRRQAEQRVLARQALDRRRETEKNKLDRYVRSVFQSHVGEVVESHDGRRYQVQEDGSLRRVAIE